jgi:hypothetical protein
MYSPPSSSLTVSLRKANGSELNAVKLSAIRELNTTAATVFNNQESKNQFFNTASRSQNTVRKKKQQSLTDRIGKLVDEEQ